MIEQTIPCTEATAGRRTGRPYAWSRVIIGKGRYEMSAHRAAFEQAWGVRIPEGAVVRHTCANPACVNPLHLMIGTQGDNNRDTVAHGHSRQAQKTHCPRGHEYSPDNLVGGKKGRNCKRCHAMHERHRRQRAAQSGVSREGA